MHGKTFFWSVAAWVLVLALGATAVAQGRSREHFRGIINDFTAAHDAKGNPSGPWELHGVWRLDLSSDGSTADFSSALTMENSDYWLLINPNPPADPDSPATRNPHTHHITMRDAQVTSDPSSVASGCPTASYTSHYDGFYGHWGGERYGKWRLPAICPPGSNIAAHGLRNGRNPGRIFEHNPGVRIACERPLWLASDQRRGSPEIAAPNEASRSGGHGSLLPRPSFVICP